MKKVMFFSLVIFAFMISANAQNRFSVKNRVDNLKERLSLSDKQAAQIDSILTVAMKKAGEITENGQGRREAMRKIMTDADSQIKNILTEKQKSEYEKLIAERMSRMRRWQSGNNKN